MYRGKWSLVCVMFFISYWLKDVGAAEMTLENLQQMYKNSTPGYQICYFDGSFCARGQEYCNVVERTCKSLFPKYASEETKLATCKEVIQRNETEPGVYDTCVYFFGELESRRVFEKHTEDHPHGTHPMRAPGKELCRYPDIFCQLGYEFCNITSGNCEPLFPYNASDTEKRQRCEQVIRNNMTMLKDACKYALGNMKCSEFGVTDKKAAEKPNHNLAWGISMSVLFVMGVIAFLVFIKCKKLLCFKETQTPPVQFQTTPVQIQPSNVVNIAPGDIDVEAEENRRNLIKNEENAERD